MARTDGLGEGPYGKYYERTAFDIDKGSIQTLYDGDEKGFVMRVAALKPKQIVDKFKRAFS